MGVHGHVTYIETSGCLGNGRWETVDRQGLECLRCRLCNLELLLKDGHGDGGKRYAVKRT